MANHPIGKHVMAWKLKDISGGNLALQVEQAKRLKLSGIDLKLAEGIYTYNRRLGLFDDQIFDFIGTMAENGISVWGWQYVYGNEPEREADRAIERINTFRLPGWIVNAEVEYKQPGKTSAAVRYMNRLHATCPNIAIGLCSYRYPDLHMEFPWAAFLEKCNFHYPQVYWEQAHNPVYQLEKSYNQYRKLESSLALPELPYIPVGAAYHWNGWQPTLIDLDAFNAKALSMGLAGISWWEWGHMQRYGFVDTIAAQDWGVIVPPPPPPINAIKMRVVQDRLNVRTGPDTNYVSIGDLKAEDEVEALDIGGVNAWVKIIYNGREAWVNVQYGADRNMEII